MTNRGSRTSQTNKSGFPWQYLPYVVIAILVVINAWLLPSVLINDQSMHGTGHDFINTNSYSSSSSNHNHNENDNNDEDSIAIPVYHKQSTSNTNNNEYTNNNNNNGNSLHSGLSNKNFVNFDRNDNPCFVSSNFSNLIYVYDIPYELRDESRKLWYELFYRLKNYDDKESLNYGFGETMEMSLSQGSNKEDYYYTHMHSLEIIFNERLVRQSSKYITNDPSKATLFWIPFPFALHFRYWHGRSWEQIEDDHQKLQNWLDNNKVYQEYIGKKPHFITWGRIAYETGQIRRRKTAFWAENRYWILSIDRNCHGDPDSCWKRISMPHPSVYHPHTIESLKQRIIKSQTNKRDVLVSFCGAVRTPTRQRALDICESTKNHPRWKEMFDGTLCEFDDSLRIDDEMKKTVGSQAERRRQIELLFSKQCTELYERSVFCIQQGADSTTRKGLWDGIVAGCIPVFLNGVMDNEFDCYGGNNYPWYVVLNPEYYVKQLLSFSADYVELLQRNLKRMVPKIIYTDGNAGFNDAIDVIIACMIRKTAIENRIDNPQCTPQELVNYDWYEMDSFLGYDKLYQQLGIE